MRPLWASTSARVSSIATARSVPATTSSAARVSAASALASAPPVRLRRPASCSSVAAPLPIACAEGEVRREVAPRPVQLGVQGDELVEGTARPPRALRREHRREDGVAAEGVVEAELVIAFRLHQTRGGGGAQCGEHVGFGRAEGTGQESPVEPPPQHRSHLDAAARPLRERREPSHDQLADGGRNGHRGIDSCREQLLDQQRRAPGPAAERSLGRGGHLAAQTGRGHRADLRAGQGRQSEHRARVATVEATQQVGGGAGLVSCGDDQQDPPDGDGVGQVLHHGERVRIGPVQVLERQHDPAGAEHREQPQHGFAEHDQGVVGPRSG